MKFNPSPKPPKREPKPKTAIKRTALKPKPYTFKSSKPIRRVSAKQAKKIKGISELKEAKNEAQEMYCEACGNTGLCTPSHLIPQGKSHELATKSFNVHWHCQYPCQDNCETGKFWLMRDGLQIMEILWQYRPERFWKFWYDNKQNRDLFKHSSFFDCEIHS